VAANGTLQSNDSIALVNPVTVSGAGRLYARRSLRAPVGSSITNGKVMLGDSTGTAYIEGTFSPDTTTFESNNGVARIQGGLAYKRMTFYNSFARLDGDVTVSRLYADATCCTTHDGKGPILNGHQLTVTDSLHTNNRAGIVMKNPADLLIVSGSAWFNGYLPDTAVTAGELRVAGNFRSDYGDRHTNFRGTHTTQFNGAATQSISLSDYEQRFRDVVVNNPAGVSFSFPADDQKNPGYIEGRLSINPATIGMITVSGRVVADGPIGPIYGPVTINTNGTLRSRDSIAVENPVAITGPGRLWVGRSLRTVAGSSITNGRVLLADTTGTAYIAGTFSPDTTSFQDANGVARMQGGLSYDRMTFQNSWARLEGNVDVSRLYVYSVCCTAHDGKGPILNGHQMTVVDSLHTDNRGGILMKDPSDLLIVGGHAWLNGYIPDTAVTAGELRVAGNFRSDYGDRHTNFHGAHTTVFNGSAVQQSITLNDYSQRFGDVVVMNPTGVNFSFPGGGDATQRIEGRLSVDPATAGPISISGSVVATGPVGPFYGPLSIAATSLLRSYDSVAVGNPVAVTGQGRLWVNRSLRSVAGSSITNGRVLLGDSTGTAYIAGTFSPDTTSFQANNGVARMQGGLAYKRMAFDNSWAKLEGDVDVTRLYVYAVCCTTHDGKGPMLNGHRMTVTDSLHTDNRGGILMKDPADLLIVGGHAWLNGYIPDTSVTAGELRVAGNFRSEYGDRHTNFGGTHTVVMNGSLAQVLTINDYSQKIQNLQMTNNGAGVSIDLVSTPSGKIVGLVENFGKWTHPAGRTITLNGGLTLKSGSTLTNAGTINVQGTYTNEGATITGNPPYPVAANVKITSAAPTTFAPQTIDVQRNGTVTFDNQSGLTHNVTFSAATGKPSDITNWSTGTRVSTVTATAGSFAYQCSIHGAAMSGTVVVH
jgi:plastocyanin